MKMHTSQQTLNIHLCVVVHRALYYNYMMLQILVFVAAYVVIYLM